MREKTVKTHWYIKALIVLIITSGSSLVYFMYLDGDIVDPVLSKYELEVTTDKTEYKVGDYMDVTWKICKERPISAKINFSFINEVVAVMPEMERNIPVGCYDKPLFQIKVPECLHEGKFYAIGTITYKVNPAKTVEFNVKSNSFKVIK